MATRTFESGILRNALLWPLAIIVGFGAATLSWSEEGAPNLNLMPQPRSITRSPGSLNLGTQYNAGFAGRHDTRLDAALDRFLFRLDRQCGEICRSQYTSRDATSFLLTLKVAGPGGAVQGPDEDES
jgi:hexosaminidase